MSALSQSHALTQLVEADGTRRLRRADNAPVIAALMSGHIGGQYHRLSTVELHHLTDHDPDATRPFERLRAHRDRIDVQIECIHAGDLSGESDEVLMRALLAPAGAGR